MSDTESTKKSKKSRKNKDAEGADTTQESTKEVEEIKEKAAEIQDKSSKKSKKSDKSDKPNGKSKKTESESESESDKQEKDGSESGSESEADEKKTKSSKKKNSSTDPALDKDELVLKPAVDIYTNLLRDDIMFHLDEWYAKKAENEPESLDSSKFISWKKRHKQAIKEAGKSSSKSLKVPFSPNAECKEALKWIVCHTVDDFNVCLDELTTTETNTDTIVEEVLKCIKKHKNTGAFVPMIVTVLKYHGRFPIDETNVQFSEKEMDRLKIHNNLKNLFKKTIGGKDKKLIALAAAHLITRFVDLISIPLARLRWFCKVGTFPLATFFDVFMQVCDITEVDGADLIYFRQSIYNLLSADRKKKAKAAAKKKKEKDSKKKDKGKKGKKGKKSKKDDDDDDEASEDSDADTKKKSKKKKGGKKKAPKSDDDEDESGSEAENDNGSDDD